MDNIYEREEWKKINDGVMRPGGMLLTETLLAQGAALPGSSILEIGCGRGDTVHSLTVKGFDVWGVDISPQLIGEGYSRYMLDEGRLLIGDASALEKVFIGRRFDYVLCQCSLSAMDMAVVLKKCHSMLKPAGMLLVSDIYHRDAETNSPGITKGQWLSSFQAAGFTDIVFQDKSACLTEFVLSILWTYGREHLNNMGLCGFGKHTGYFIASARKSCYG